MNQYPQFSRFPSPSNHNVRFNGYRPRFAGGGGRPNHPPYFTNNYQQHRNPQYFPRYGPSPPMRPAPISWRFQNNPNLQPINTGRSNVHASAPALLSPNNVGSLSRPRGPRTPPDPPPESETEMEPAATHSGPPLLPSPTKRKSNKQKNKERYNKQKHRKQQEKHCGHPHEKIQGRRNSCPTLPQRRASQNLLNSNNYNSSPKDSHKSTVKPSPLNTAVQAYLLQVLTSQPPPGSIQTPPAPLVNASMPALIHPPPPLPPKSLTPPPLPPSPMQTSNPPPPPVEDNEQEKNLGSQTNATNNEGKGERSSLSLNKFKSALNIDIPKGEPPSIQEISNDKTDPPLVKLKAKRKKISDRKATLKDWTKEEALMALKAEQELSKEFNRDTILFLRFPDPPLSRELVKSFSADIESVHFQQNSAPRFCFAHLRDGVNVDEIIETISKIPFGSGFVKAELRQLPALKTNAADKVENIDPYTLYVGNLSTTVPCKVLKEHFPGAARIDIGFAQRMKYTRYAFIRYHKVEEAIAAYRRMLNAEIDGRSLILRFRRFSAGSKESDLDNSSAVLDEEEELADAYSMHSSSTPTLASDVAESVDMPIKKVLAERGKLRAAKDLNKIIDSFNESLIPKVVPESEPTTPKATEQHRVVDEATDSEKVGVQNSSALSQIESEAMNGSVVVRDTAAVVNREEESETDNMEHEVECDVSDTTNNRLDDSREMTTADAGIENAISTPSIENAKSKTLPSIPTDQRIPGSIEGDTMVSRINAENIKSEPNQSIDDDIVTDRIVPRQACDLDIKDESKLDEDLEFFAGGVHSQSKAAAQNLFAAIETSSVASESSDSSCSLSNFLRLCESSQDSNEEVDNSTAPPPRKRTKSTESPLITATPAENPSSTRVEVKEEDIEGDLIPNTHATLLGLRHSLNQKETSPEIKQESMGDTVDEDILIIDSDENLLRTINGNVMEEEFISQTPTAQNSKHNHRDKAIDNADDDDDLVPPNAFLLQKKRKTPQKLRVHPLLLKEEYLEWDTASRFDTMEKRIRPTKDQITRPTKPDFLRSAQAKPVNTLKNKPPILSSNDDDDLVPENNALCSRQSSIAFFDLTLEDEPVVTIKSEMETEDLFSLPKNVDKRKVSSRLANKKGSEIKQEITKDNARKSTKNKQTAAESDTDDDIVIISDDILPVTGTRTTLTTSRDVGHSQDQSDVLRLKRETPSPATVDSLFEHHKKSSVAKLEKTFFGKHKISRHGDNLDRLFELLNSDSDEDL